MRYFEGHPANFRQLHALRPQHSFKSLKVTWHGGATSLVTSHEVFSFGGHQGDISSSGLHVNLWHWHVFSQRRQVSRLTLGRYPLSLAHPPLFPGPPTLILAPIDHNTIDPYQSLYLRMKVEMGKKEPIKKTLARKKEMQKFRKG